jgi:glycogen debranching enzyme
MAVQLSNRSSLATPYPLPVVSNSAPTYNASLYWRGPVWININWITIFGLQRYGLEQQATELRRKTMALVAKTDVLREYYNSQTGAGEGAQNFMWTAALYVAMALQEPK